MSTSSHIKDRLCALASRVDPAARAIGDLRRLSGGATQEIWKFALDVAAGGAPLILRRAPGGDRISEESVGLEMEARLLVAAGAAGIPVPKVRYVLQEEDGLGHGFIMDFVEGETLGGRIVKSETLASARAVLASQCGDILARIHAIATAEFPGLDRLTPGDLIEQWQATYRRSAWPRPVFDLAFRWLADRCPAAPIEPRLVHGDFRNGNLMIGSEGVRAVLDWELAHVGDHHEDFGWLCVNSWRFGRIDKPVGGFGDREALFDAYAAAGGAPIDLAAVTWWEVFGTLRWGVICAGSAEAFRTADPTIERAMIGRRTSETEIDILRLIAN